MNVDTEPGVRGEHTVTWHLSARQGHQFAVLTDTGDDRVGLQVSVENALLDWREAVRLGCALIRAGIRARRGVVQ
ncbi:hypothetical protein PHAEDRUS_2 [Mycobacterium phage Phaedrus]|uniref:hypothetical protein n=1 Tax=Mycobacterium phage Phaedrus TaxID=546184 RepID=UPI0001799283|nr:hypothetical protein PHAEDRUS_2 [Mycobacterium phage Phaedrus]ACF33966.1 hypothetical protein PHAEDRUS_2 [Mycobacterium phage Phaedrus]